MLKNEGVETRLDLYRGLPHAFWHPYKELPQSKQWDERTMKGFAWLLSYPEAWQSFVSIRNSCIRQLTRCVLIIGVPWFQFNLGIRLYEVNAWICCLHGFVRPTRQRTEISYVTTRSTMLVQWWLGFVTNVLNPSIRWNWHCDQRASGLLSVASV